MSSNDTTTVTFRFEGDGHLNAADALYVITIAAGLDDEIKRRLANRGITVSDISTTKTIREIAVKLA